MKLLMLMGAGLGFGLGFFLSLMRESSWPNVLWHACAGAYAAGWLLRWWGRRWEAGLRLALAEKQSDAARANHPANPPKR